MDRTEVLKLAKKYADIIENEIGSNRVYLFGSYAKGNFNTDSDIDLAVIFKDYDESIDMQLELMRLRRNLDSRIEPHQFKEKDFNISNPLAFEILTYGKEII